MSTVIAVFCYNRPDKLKISIEALLKNPECSEMEIIFFSDGPKGEKDLNGVMETRRYINSVEGFLKVTKIYRAVNFSTGPNFKAALIYLCDNYDQFIVVEDDIVVRPNYLKYLLDALSFYQSDPKVFCITAFTFPVSIQNYPYDTVVHSRFSAYGWGSWANRVKHVVWDEVELKKMLKTKPGFKKRLDAEGLDLFRMLRKQLSGALSTWDVQMQVHISEHGYKVIYPLISKTSNIGFGGESTNTFGVDFVQTPQDLGIKRSFDFCRSDYIVKELLHQLRHPFSFSVLLKRKIINTAISFRKKFSVK